jgi:hypothetical protein
MAGNEIKYEIIDFNGYVQWVQLDDASYAVDPLYLEEFLNTIR